MTFTPRILLAVTLALLASAPEELLANPSPQSPAISALSERAMQALHDDAPLDYERPLLAKPYDREATVGVLLSSCRHGTKQACWIAAQISATSGPAYALVEANCIAGDLMSCRALPKDVDKPRFPKARGAMSRSVACTSFPRQAGCDLAKLHQECLEGFPNACIEFTNTPPPAPDALKLIRTVDGLQDEGCRAWIADDCNIAQEHGPPSQRREMAEHLCDLDRDQCWRVSQYETEPARAVEDFERSCQYGKAQWPRCIKVAADYLAKKYKEPVPGRGQALLERACPAVHASVKSPYFEKYFPACGSTTP